MASKRPKKNTSLCTKRNKCINKYNVSFQNEYKSPTFKESFRKCFISTSESIRLDGSEALIVKKPFRACVLPNFVEDTSFLDDLKDELSDLKLNEKNNDLYKFHQSQDLNNIVSPAVVSLKHLLYDDFKSWLQDITGIPLNETVDMNCSHYEYTDVLLCHDDELEGRRIAFILYLVESTWLEKDGGTLDLFSTDDHGQPSTITKSLIPKKNNFVFFEVTPTSFHQVSEILNKDATRLSVSGWFHGTSILREKPLEEPQSTREKPGFVEESVLRSWINPTYLEADVQIKIQEKFQDDSEIELQDFLQAEKYQQLAEVLLANEIKWNQKGPANKRCFSAVEEDLPELVQECLRVLKSEAMFLILSNMSGLRLHSLVEDCSSSSEDDEAADEQKREPSDATCRTVVRRWRHRDYTLIHDQDQAVSECALDATLYFNCEDWEAECGGYTSYIAKGEDEELLTVYPRPNSLALVYKDKETLRFVKHINHRVTERRKPEFQDIFSVYYE